jgi:alpha-1,2-glucosyltransferase
MKISETQKTVAFFSLSFMTLVCGFFYFKNMLPLVDEQTNYLQILTIAREKTLFPNITTVAPGYHWIMAFFCSLFHSLNGLSIRFLNMVLSFVCVLVFFLLAKKINRNGAFQKTVLFFLFPILVPYFFLIYTDVVSVLFVTSAFLCAVSRRFRLAGLFCMLSVFVRQNNIVWAVFTAVYIYLDNYYPQWRWKDVRKWAAGYSFLLLGPAALLFYFLVNKGLTFGDKQYHHVSLTVENIYFCLFIAFFLFLPYHLSNTKKIFVLLKQNRKIWLVLPALFLLHMFFFKAKHFYNSPEIFHHFLRNQVLGAMVKTQAAKAISFLPIACVLLSLRVTRFENKLFYLLYPFTILFLLPLPLIEHRYYFIPYTLFLLFKERDPLKIAIPTLVLYAIAAIYLLRGIKAEMFFL